MKYEFWTTDGRFLQVVETDDPAKEIMFVAAQWKLPTKDIEYTQYQPVLEEYDE